MNSLEYIYSELGENICLYPFLGAFYQTNNVIPKHQDAEPNTIRPCSIIQYENLSDWNVENRSLVQSRNNTHWKQLRQDFVDGKFHQIKSCAGCSYNERAGATSPRLMNNKFYSEFVKADIVQAVKNIIHNNNEVKEIYTLDYYPSNYCNFSCIMCSGGEIGRAHV